MQWNKYLAINNNQVLTYATTWMDVENMFSERRQTQKSTQHMTPFV